MPAVQLIQLNQQINALVAYFAEPNRFRSELESLLIRYADLTYKPGDAVKRSSLSTTSYRTAPIVLRKLEQRMAGLAAFNPDLTLGVADTLWATDQTETRQLAAVLIGNLPQAYSGEVLARLQAWTVPGVEFSHLQTLFQQGSSQLRQAEPQKWLNLIRTWLNSSDRGMVRLGTLAITSMAADRDYDNLPAIFNAISPVLGAAPEDLQHELRQLLTQLARRSPTETGYFLRQVMGLYPTRTLARLVRRVLPEFPEEIQVRLRSTLLAHSWD